MKLFQKVNMASESIDSAMRSGIVVTSVADNTPIAAHPGDFVTPIGIVTSSVYNLPDENVFAVTAPAAATQSNLFVLDPVKVAEATNDDLVYRMGARTLGLPVNAGEVVAMRQLFINDQFLLGKENFATTPAKGDKYTIAANAYTLAKVDAGDYATTPILFRIDDVRKITEGIGLARQSDAYLVTVELI